MCWVSSMSVYVWVSVWWLFMCCGGSKCPGTLSPSLNQAISCGGTGVWQLQIPNGQSWGNRNYQKRNGREKKKKGENRANSIVLIPGISSFNSQQFKKSYFLFENGGSMWGEYSTISSLAAEASRFYFSWGVGWISSVHSYNRTRLNPFYPSPYHQH